MYVSKQRKKNQRIRFVEEVENSDQEERTARGFAARKEREAQRKRLKMADNQWNQELAMAFENIKTADVSRITSAGEAKSAYQKLLSDFLTAMGAPADMTDTQERLNFFQFNYRTATIEVLEDKERELGKSYLLGICINRDYKNTFTNILSLSSSEDSADRPPVLPAGTVDALPQPLGDALSQNIRAHIAKPFSNSGDSKKRGQTERNAASSEVKKQKMEGQAQEDEKEADGNQ